MPFADARPLTYVRVLTELLAAEAAEGRQVLDRLSQVRHTAHFVC